MHLSILVVCQGILLKALGHKGVRYLQHLIALNAFGQEFEDIEQLACIASAISQQGIGFLQFYVLLLEHHILFKHSLA